MRYPGRLNSSRQATRAELTFQLIWGVLLRLAIVLGAFYFLYRVRFILITVIISALLALVLNPLVDRLQRNIPQHWGNRQTQRLIVTLAVFLLFLGVFILANIYFVAPFKHELSKLVNFLRPDSPSLKHFWGQFQQWYKTLPPDLRSFLASQDFSQVLSRLGEMLRGMVISTLEWLAHIVDIILIPVLAFYFVLDSRSLKREFLFFVPRHRVRDAIILLREAAKILQSYAIAQITLALIAGIVVGTGLWLLKVDYALTLGVIAGITRAIPIIGPIIGGIPIVGIVALQNVTRALWVLLFFTLMHFAESKILLPKLLEYHMRLHPAMVIIVLLIGGEFGGLIGMFLAAPVASLLETVYKYFVLERKKPQSIHPSEARRFKKPPSHKRYARRSFR